MTWCPALGLAIFDDQLVLFLFDPLDERLHGVQRLVLGHRHIELRIQLKCGRMPAEEGALIPGAS